MTDADITALHQKWLKEVHEKHYSKRHLLNLYFSTVAELQGMSASTDEMFEDVRRISAVFDGLLELVARFSNH